MSAAYEAELANYRERKQTGPSRRMLASVTPSEESILEKDVDNAMQSESDTPAMRRLREVVFFARFLQLRQEAEFSDDHDFNTLAWHPEVDKMQKLRRAWFAEHPQVRQTSSEGNTSGKDPAPQRVRHRIIIRHPGYTPPPVLFVFPAYDPVSPDSPNLCGCNHRVVLDACHIIADNCAGFLSTSAHRDDSHRVPETERTLTADVYYYFLSDESDPQYAVVDRFAAWRFPDALPVHWQPVSSIHRDRAEFGVSHEVGYSTDPDFNMLAWHPEVDKMKKLRDAWFAEHPQIRQTSSASEGIADA
ncbi:hypothetical protein DAEQUDRAFT_769401 [Daedalea quercina L-15889]|uniref:HNH nuclease domain-containing protein n=1 Tax=Daedalea quercina L-15889 TaxID=1314783 RepID=A0A165LRD7_9APHY|nr:hypothetical protein DAEQUDRAFT_769401 [Daedalea quercina L-15889]